MKHRVYPFQSGPKSS